jgi:hypothetical protein
MVEMRHEVGDELEALAGMPKGGARVVEIFVKASLKSLHVQEKLRSGRNFHSQCSK